VRRPLSTLVARNFARDVAHDAAKIGFLQGAFGAVELLGMRVALLMISASLPLRS
jgi:hypothetical protein